MAEGHVGPAGRWTWSAALVGWPALGPAVLLAAAIVPELRPIAAVVLIIGWTVLRLRRHAGVIAWAAALPLGIALTWPWILGPDAPMGAVGCTDPLSTIAVHRLALAAVVLTVVVALAVVERSGRAELGLPRPSAGEGLLSLGGLAALAVGGLVIGPAIARPFFGQLDFPVPPAALVPAVLFGIANGATEEVMYRGALQAWLGRVVPVWVAIAFQGLVFGIVHAGPDVVSLLPVHVVLLALVGIAGGVVRRRIGSLWIPIGVHVGADIALYVGLACRG